ncbi:MAG: hypothetical protein GY830_01110 [Bacteroidetes bacterium]|nr:hypothetical protein [Bacteroidota bacterium]
MTIYKYFLILKFENAMNYLNKNIKLICCIYIITACNIRYNSKKMNTNNLSIQNTKDLILNKHSNTIIKMDFSNKILKSYSNLKEDLLNFVNNDLSDKNLLVKKMGGSVPLVYGAILGLFTKMPDTNDYDFLKFCIQNLNISLLDLRNGNNILHIFCWRISYKSDNKIYNNISSLFKIFIQAVKECNKFNELVKLSYNVNRTMHCVNNKILGGKTPLHKIFSILNTSQIQYEIAEIMINDIRKGIITKEEALNLLNYINKRILVDRKGNDTFLSKLANLLNSINLSNSNCQEVKLVINTIKDFINKKGHYSKINQIFLKSCISNNNHLQNNSNQSSISVSSNVNTNNKKRKLEEVVSIFPNPKKQKIEYVTPNYQVDYQNHNHNHNHNINNVINNVSNSNLNWVNNMNNLSYNNILNQNSNFNLIDVSNIMTSLQAPIINNYNSNNNLRIANIPNIQNINTIYPLQNLENTNVIYTNQYYNGQNNNNNIVYLLLKPANYNLNYL